MSSPIRLARIALALVAVYALVRLIDPEQRWARLLLGGDRVEHAVVAYLITAFSLVAFPRLALWTPALAFTALGIAVEAVQAHQAIIGDAQPGDVAADAVGAAAATFPFWLARLRARKS